LAVFTRWQIICIFAAEFNHKASWDMLIALITTILVALIFGKITFKEVKEYVRRRRRRRRKWRRRLPPWRRL